MRVIILLKVMVHYKLLTPQEAQFCLMTGILPKDIMKRLEAANKKFTVFKN